MSRLDTLQLQLSHLIRKELTVNTKVQQKPFFCWRAMRSDILMQLYSPIFHETKHRSNLNAIYNKLILFNQQFPQRPSIGVFGSGWTFMVGPLVGPSAHIYLQFTCSICSKTLPSVLNFRITLWRVARLSWAIWPLESFSLKAGESWSKF